MIKCFGEWRWTAETRHWAVFQILTSVSILPSKDPNRDIYELYGILDQSYNMQFLGIFELI